MHSGGFVNPLLTLLYATRRILAPPEALALIAFEFLDAFLAGAVVYYVLLPSNPSFSKSRWFDLAMPGFSSSFPVSKAFIHQDLNFLLRQ